MNYLLNDLLVAVFNHSTFGIKSGKSTFDLQDIIEKKLHALEIIEEHKLLNYIFKNEKCTNMYHLSKEEIEFLKEVCS